MISRLDLANWNKTGVRLHQNSENSTSKIPRFFSQLVSEFAHTVSGVFSYKCMKLIITRKAFQLASFRKRGYSDWLVNSLLDPDYGKEWDKNLNQTHGSLP